MEKERLALANNIRFLRKAKGLNQEQLANKLNIKRSNIAAYEAKNVEPRLRVILELSRFFDIQLTFFLNEKLSEGVKYPPFSLKSTTPDLEPIPLDIDEKKVNEFIDKAIKIKKVLVGFKSFYAFRKEKLQERSPDNVKIIFDIDNFIQLMEDLIHHNESMIRLLSANTK